MSRISCGIGGIYMVTGVISFILDLPEIMFIIVLMAGALALLICSVVYSYNYYFKHHEDEDYYLK